MRANRTLLLALLLTTLSGTALASDITTQSVWIRGTVPGQKATGAFMEITSKSGATLIGASSPVAGITEIHEMKMAGGIMSMRAIPRLELPAGQRISLASGGYHVMLMDLKQTLKAGDSVPLTLKVLGKDKKVEAIEVKAEVRDLAATPMSSGHNH